MTTNSRNPRPNVNLTVVNAREDEQHQKDINHKINNANLFNNLCFAHPYGGNLVQNKQVVFVNRETSEDVAMSGQTGGDMTQISQIPVIGILNGITAENAYDIMKKFCPLGVSLSRNNATLSDNSTTVAVAGPTTVPNNGDRSIFTGDRIMVAPTDLKNPRVHGPTEEYPHDGPNGRIPLIYQPVNLETVGKLNETIIKGAFEAKAAHDNNPDSIPSPSAHDLGIIELYNACMRDIQKIGQSGNLNDYENNSKHLARIFSRMIVFNNILRDWTIGRALTSAAPGESFDLLIEKI